MITLPYATLVTVLPAALLGDWPRLPEALGLSFALLGAIIATGAFASVRFPYAIPQDNPFGNSAPGQGGLAAISLFGGGLTGAACCLPLVGLTVYLHVSDHHATSGSSSPSAPSTPSHWPPPPSASPPPASWAASRKS